MKKIIIILMCISIAVCGEFKTMTKKEKRKYIAKIILGGTVSSFVLTTMIIQNTRSK